MRVKKVDKMTVWPSVCAQCLCPVSVPQNEGRNREAAAAQWTDRKSVISNAEMLSLKSTQDI